MAAQRYEPQAECRDSRGKGFELKFIPNQSELFRWIILVWIESVRLDFNRFESEIKNLFWIDTVEFQLVRVLIVE